MLHPKKSFLKVIFRHTINNLRIKATRQYRIKLIKQVNKEKYITAVEKKQQEVDTKTMKKM